MILKILFSFLLIFIIVNITLGQARNQPPKNKAIITPEEKQQALDFANRFVKRMKETRDLSPLISEMFVSNFERNYNQDGSWAGFIGMPSSLVLLLNDDERLRLYASRFTLDYLFRLHFASKIPLDEEHLKKAENLIPQSIVDYSNANELPSEEIKKPEDARRILSITEHTLKLLKTHLADNPPEATMHFKENLVSFAKHIEGDEDWGQPSAKDINREFLGFPAGTRFIRMEIPFHIGLILVKEKGQMKLLFAISMIPPD